MQVEIPTSLSIEYIASGLVGLVMLGLMAKRLIEGYAEARKHMASQSANPIIQAMANTWDKNQQERFLQLLERLVLAAEVQAKHQGALADRQQMDIQEKLDTLLERLDDMPVPVKR